MFSTQPNTGLISVISAKHWFNNTSIRPHWYIVGMTNRIFQKHLLSDDRARCLNHEYNPSLPYFQGVVHIWFNFAILTIVVTIPHGDVSSN